MSLWLHPCHRVVRLNRLGGPLCSNSERRDMGTYFDDGFRWRLWIWTLSFCLCIATRVVSEGTHTKREHDSRQRGFAGLLVSVVKSRRPGQRDRTEESVSPDVRPPLPPSPAGGLCLPPVVSSSTVRSRHDSGFRWVPQYRRRRKYGSTGSRVPPTVLQTRYGVWV